MGIMLGPIFMGVSHTWRLPFMYWNQQTADYYAGHCTYPCFLLTNWWKNFYKGKSAYAWLPTIVYVICERPLVLSTMKQKRGAIHVLYDCCVLEYTLEWAQYRYSYYHSPNVTHDKIFIIRLLCLVNNWVESIYKTQKS